jgi:hypothetical protein
VHVDFTIGTSSVLSNSTDLKPAQQVVVDGQEKLVDGSPVTPAQAHSIPAASSGGSVGAANPNAQSSAPAAGSGGLPGASPVPPDQSGNSGNAGQNGNPPGSRRSQNQGQSAPSTGGGSH